MAQGAGIFSKLGGYVMGASAEHARYIGQLGMYAARGGLGRTTQGAMLGSMAGGAYGAFSDDTSVTGGAIGGGLLGAGGARYGGAGALAGSVAGRGMGIGRHGLAYGQAFGAGVANMAKRDLMRARVGFASLRSNFGRRVD